MSRLDTSRQLPSSSSSSFSSSSPPVSSLLVPASPDHGLLLAHHHFHLFLDSSCTHVHIDFWKRKNSALRTCRRFAHCLLCNFRHADEHRKLPSCHYSGVPLYPSSFT